MAEQTAVFKISVDSAQAVQAIADYSRKIEELKESEKQLREEIKKQGGASEKQAKELVKIAEQRKAYARELQESSKQVQNNMKAAQAEEGSLKQLRAQLSNLTKAYDELSKAQREGIEGEELKEKINQVTDLLKEAEEGTQRYYRNVANYEGALSKMFGNTAVHAAQTVVNIEAVIVSAKGAIPAFRAMGAAASTALGPIGIIVMIIVAAFKLLKEAVMGSEDSSNRAREAFSWFKRVLEQTKMVIEVLANVLMMLHEAIMWVHKSSLELLSTLNKYTGLTFIAEILDDIISAQERYNEALKIEHQLAKENRKLNEKNADRELKIAKLRDQASDKITYSAKQRLQFLREAQAEEKRMSQEKADMARREYENIKELNSLTQSSAEDNEKLSEAYVKMRREEMEFFKKNKELNAQMKEAMNQIIEEERKLREERTKRYEEYIAMAQEAIDIVVSLYQEGSARETEIIRNAYNRQIDELRAKIKTEEELSKSERQTINNLIVALEAKKKSEIKKAEKAYNEQRKRNALQVEKEIADIKISLMLDSLEKSEAVENKRYERRKQEIESQYKLEEKLIEGNIFELENLRDSATNKTEKKRFEKQIQVERENLTKLNELYKGNNGLIVAEKDKHNAELAKIRKEWAEKTLKEEMAEETLKWKNKIAEAKVNGEDWLAIQLEQKKAELDALHKLEEESEEEFRSRQLESQIAYNEAMKAISEDRKKDLMEQAEMYLQLGSVIGALGNIVEQFGEENKAASRAAKILAAMDIATQTAVAIAKGVASASGVPFPGNLAAIASTVATVMANAATAISIFKGEAFATGGYVSGAGSGTSDSVPARLSNGESVNNARATSMFSPIYSSLNQMGGGVPIVATQTASQIQGEEMLARAFAKGMANANIRVGVDEISRVQNRVKVVENLGTL